MIIRSIEDLKQIMADKSFRSAEIQLDGVSELDFIDCLKDCDFRYGRTGFKRWLITSNQAIHEKKYLVRLRAVILILALAFIITLIGSFVIMIINLSVWKKIEDFASNYTIIFTIISSIFLAVTGWFWKKILYRFFKEYYNNYLYGTKGRT